MHIRSLILASVAAAALSVAFAAPSTAETCFTGSIFGGPFVNGEQCFTAKSLNDGSGSASPKAVVPAAVPVAVSPAPVVPSKQIVVPAVVLTVSPPLVIATK